MSEASNRAVEILLVEDNPRHADLIRDELEVEIPGATVTLAEGLEIARTAVAGRVFDAVILDFRLPDGDGLELLRELRDAGRGEPIVFVTTTASAAVAVQAMKLGAADYVVKEEGYVSIVPFVVRDVLERTRLRDEHAQLERRLERAEHLASLHKLTGGIAHNLNNPLTTVRTFLELLPSRYSTDEEFRTSYYELVLAELDRIRDLIGSLMRAVTVSESDDNPPWSLGELMQELAGCVRAGLREKALQLEQRAEEGLPSLPRGREAIKQTLIILLDNAVAFSPHGATISLRAGLKREASRPEILVEVADQGPGVPEEQRGRIFDPFFSTRPGGVGIGLFVASCLARAHGGSLDVAAGAPAGAVFSLALPVEGGAGRAAQGRTGRGSSAGA